MDTFTSLSYLSKSINIHGIVKGKNSFNDDTLGNCIHSIRRLEAPLYANLCYSLYLVHSITFLYPTSFSEKK